MATTIQEIAKLAGVSVATVSHVVNKTRYVSPETVQKVENVINTLDELPDFITKKRNRQEKSVENFVLIFTTNVCNKFQSDVLKAISNKLMTDDNTTLITVHTDNLQTTLKNYNLSNTENYLGKIVLLDEKTNLPLKCHSSMKMLPTVLISENSVETLNSNVNDMNIIVSDCYTGSYSVVNHLIKNGHTRIAIIDRFCVTGESTTYNTDILLGYKHALKEHNVKLDELLISANLIGEKDINNYLRYLFFEIEPPTAIYVANEEALLFTLKFIKDYNLECPKDLSIVSFNYHSWYDYFSPPISCVKQNTEYIGEKALEILDKGLTIELKGVENSIIVPTNVCINPSIGGIGNGPFGEKAANMDELYLSENEKSILSKNKYTAVISFHYTGAAWMYLHEQGIKDVFNDLGISLLAITDAHFDPEMQNRQLESLLALKPDIFIAIPAEDNLTSKAFKKVAKSDSKLILITNVPKGLTQDDYISCVSVNEWSHGRLAGSGLGDSMRNYKKRNIGFLVYDSDFYATNQRDAAARQILIEDFPDLSILGETKFKHEDEVFENTIQLIKDFPEIEGLYISWEGPATKALEALHSIGRSEVIIGTADLDYSLGINMAKSGNVKAVSAQLPFEQGQALALVAANALLGKDVPKFIGVEPIMVNKENLLDSWERIFKETAPKDLVDAIKTFE